MVARATNELTDVERASSKGMARFQDAEATRFRPIVGILQDLHKAAVNIYSGLQPDAIAGAYSPSVTDAVRAFIQTYEKFLMDAVKDAAQQAVRDSQRAMKVAADVVFESAVIDYLLEQQAVVRPHSSLRNINDDVLTWMQRRGAGSTFPTLSGAIWNFQYFTESDLMRIIGGQLSIGASAQEFSRVMERYLLPSAQVPTEVPSTAVSKQPRNVAYNAYRLARTETMLAYNEGRRDFDSRMVGHGLVVGSRWLLSSTHAARVGRDVCDEHAEIEFPGLEWLTDYGISRRGIHPSLITPREHPNGLCTTVPVTTPRALIDRIIMGEPPSQVIPGFPRIPEPPEGFQFRLLPGTPMPAPQPRDPLTEAWFTGNFKSMSVDNPRLLASWTAAHLGREYSAEEIARMVGVLNTSRVLVSVGQGGIYIDAEDADGFRQYTNQTTIGANHIYNALLVHAGGPKGLGARVTANEVKSAREWGIKQIELSAAGSPGNPSWNGYYTWARLGYNGTLSSYEIEDAAKALRVPPSQINRVLDIIELPGGPEWWKKHGSGRHLYFDTDPDSQSSRVLQKYLDEHGIVV